MNDKLADEIERLTISREQTSIRSLEFSVREWRQIIAALRLGHEPVPEGFVRTVPDPQMRTMCTAEAMGQLDERPPSGEMVMVEAACKAICKRCSNGDAVELQVDPTPTYWHDAVECRASPIRLLSAAEAEGRKG